jgi:hypothetical protein
MWPRKLDNETCVPAVFGSVRFGAVVPLSSGDRLSKGMSEVQQQETIANIRGRIIR